MPHEPIPGRIRVSLQLALAASGIASHGCTATDHAPTLQQLEALDLGEPLPWTMAKGMARHVVSKQLRDEDSAKFNFEPLVKTWYQLDANTPPRAAFMLKVECNAKNAFGAYVGFRPYRFYFLGEQIVAISTPEEGIVEINGGGKTFDGPTTEVRTGKRE